MSTMYLTCLQVTEIFTKYRILPMLPMCGKDPAHVLNTWKGSYLCSQYVERILPMFSIRGKVPSHVPPNNI